MRKVIRHSITCLALFMTCRVLAAEQQIYEVFVDIPGVSFYVLPEEARLSVDGLALEWDVSNGGFAPFRTHFTVLNSNGGLSVKLEESVVLHRSDKTSQIELEVKLNDTSLSINSKLIVDDAKTPKRLALDIKANMPRGGYIPGNYVGSMSLIFEASPP